MTSSSELTASGQKRGCLRLYYICSLICSHRALHHFEALRLLEIGKEIMLRRVGQLNQASKAPCKERTRLGSRFEISQEYRGSASTLRLN